MKSIFLGLLVVSFTATAFAEKLLSCNPPMGSGLQEVKITQVGNKFYHEELNFSGSRSERVEIDRASWINKDLKWTSPAEGEIRLKLVNDGEFDYWSYQATGIGFKITGSCNEMPQ